MQADDVLDPFCAHIYVLEMLHLEVNVQCNATAVQLDIP